MRNPAMKGIVAVPAATLLALALTVSGSTPAEAASNSTSETVTIHLPAWSTVACNGEPVLFEDGLFSLTVTRTVNDNSGGVHIKNQLKMDARKGVGLVTGSKYRYFSNSETSSQHPGPPATVSHTQTLTNALVGQKPDNNLLVQTVAKFTVNANGLVVVDFVQINSQCPSDSSGPGDVQVTPLVGGLP